MKTNNNEYHYTVEPYFNKVRAEIFKISEPLFKTGQNIHIHLIDKTFGRWYRKPIKEDYVKAREWAEEQMQCIFHANK